MILLARLLIGLSVVLDTVLSIFVFMLFARVIISWLNADPYNPIVQFVMRATDPVINPVRRRVKPVGMLDLSPLIVLLVIYFLQATVVGALKDYGERIRWKALQSFNHHYQHIDLAQLGSLDTFERRAKLELLPRATYLS